MSPSPPYGLWSRRSRRLQYGWVVCAVMALLNVALGFATLPHFGLGWHQVVSWGAAFIAGATAVYVRSVKRYIAPLVEAEEERGEVTRTP